MHRHGLWVQRFLAALVAFAIDINRRNGASLRFGRNDIFGKNSWHAHRINGDALRMDAIRPRLDIHAFLRSAWLLGSDLGPRKIA